MFSPLLLFPGLLALLPALGHAQAAEPLVPRYYVGLALYNSPYQPLSGGGYRTTTIPFQITAGYQLRPRLAGQLGVAYNSSSSSYFGISRYFTAGGPARGIYFDYSSEGRERNTSVALLARYTLSRRAAHRLQVDMLGGVTTEISHYAFSRVYSDSSQVPVTNRYEDQGTDWSLLLTAGPSVRCRLGRHLEALLDFTLSYDLNRDHHRNTSEVTGATALGLRYRFGRPD